MTKYNSKNIIIFEDSRAILLPSGTTLERPSDPLPGMIRWNKTEEYFEGYNGSIWAELGNGISISGTQYYIPMFNISGNNIQDSSIKINNSNRLVVNATNPIILNTNIGSNESSILGGKLNTINNCNSSGILCGRNNTANSSSGVAIVCGESNTICGDCSAIISGANNSLSTVPGGQYPGWSCIISGINNSIQAGYSASYYYNFIGAGSHNQLIRCINCFIGSSQSGLIFESYWSSIISGYQNIIYSLCNYSNISSGQYNTIQSNSAYSCINSGSNNSINYTNYACISSGRLNTIYASSQSSFIGAGESNVISGSQNSAILSGKNNNISASYATVLSGYSNIVCANYSSICSGYTNTILVNHTYSTIVSGENNKSIGKYSFIGGGQANNFSNSINVGDFNVIVGGEWNCRSSESGTSTIGNNIFIGGGHSNFSATSGSINIGDASVVCGGYNNGFSSTGNIIIGYASVICGGYENNSSMSGNYSFLGGGRENNTFGMYSVICGGYQNTTRGHYSFCAGFGANDNGYDNCFVWSINNDSLQISPYDDEQFIINTDKCIINAPGNTEIVNSDLHIDINKYFYIGDENTDGSWRFYISGNDLVFERRILGSWVNKQTITG